MGLLRPDNRLTSIMQLEVRSNIEFIELSHPYKIFLCRFLFYFEEWLLTYYGKVFCKILGDAKKKVQSVTEAGIMISAVKMKPSPEMMCRRVNWTSSGDPSQSVSDVTLVLESCLNFKVIFPNTAQALGGLLYRCYSF